ncbi:MAG TPA: GNAT family protein [Polyangiaceae bacterium]|nr:GNAT family protein [Polyangiaceae bacterium]
MREAMGISTSVALKGGQHALIERATEADAPRLIEYLEQAAGETDFLSFGAGEVGLTVEQEAALVRRLHGEDAGVMLKASIDGEIVGLSTLIRLPRPRVRHCGSFGLSVLRKHWALGLGRAISEAVVLEARQLGLTRIELRVRHDNPRAISLYETLGFEVEGRLRGAFMVGGVAYDDLLMGLLLHSNDASR